MVKVFLSTPCYGGLCLDKYMISVIKLQLLLINKGVQLMIDTTENESLVHRARNVAVGRFMQKTDAEYFMFIDADVHFDPESVVRLLESGRLYDRPRHEAIPIRRLRFLSSLAEDGWKDSRTHSHDIGSYRQSTV